VPDLRNVGRQTHTITMKTLSELAAEYAAANEAVIAAEDACQTAAPILVQAIKDMSVTDGLAILRGNEHAATDYLRSKTQESLTLQFKPTIQTSLANVQATKYWDQLIKAYQSIPFSNKKTNPNLTDYVTEKALQGIFEEIARQEQEIRSNPLARPSALLKRLFNKP
jgi:enolase